MCSRQTFFIVTILFLHSFELYSKTFFISFRRKKSHAGIYSDWYNKKSRDGSQCIDSPELIFFYYFPECQDDLLMHM